MRQVPGLSSVRLRRLVLGALITLSAAASVHSQPALRVDPSGRYLVDANQNPYFIAGDAGWGLIAQLSTQDANLYLQSREDLGFNVTIVRLLEHEFCSNPPRNAYGVLPFTGRPFVTPNEPYFAHADSIINLAASHGITVILAPVYLGYVCGEQGWCAEIQDATLSEMGWWGRYLGNRYKDFPNIIWLIGGDADPTPVKAKLREFVNGVKTYDMNHLFTAHNQSESYAIDPWPGESWLTLNNVYSHSTTLYENAAVAYNVTPTMPFFLIEANYENEHNSTPQELRAQIYDTILTGGCGRVFGNCPIWHFGAAPGWCSTNDWQGELYETGSAHMMYAQRLFNSRHWHRLVPDLNHSVMTAGYGTPGETDFAPVGCASDSSSIVAYLPTRRSVTINTLRLAQGRVRCWWYKPSTGQPTHIGVYNSGTWAFTPPSTGDWLLVIDRDGAGFPPPGSPPVSFAEQTPPIRNRSGLISTFPNPVDSLSQIRYRIKVPADVRLGIHDLTGREVAVLVAQQREPGEYTVSFDARRLAAGVYFCRLSAGRQVDQTKLVVAR
jgi:hypothetical protein